MQALQDTIDRIKQRAGTATPDTNFSLYNGFILIPEQVFAAPGVGMVISEKISYNQDRLQQGKPIEIPIIETPALDTNVRFGPEPLRFKAPSFILPNVADGSEWLSVAVLISSARSYTIDLHNQFIEPLNTVARGNYQGKPSLRKNIELQFLLTPQTWTRWPIKNNEDYNNAKDMLICLLSTPEIRMQHPFFNYINIAVDGELKIQEMPESGACIISATFQEVTGKTQATVPRKTLEERKKSFFEKAGDLFNKVKNYTKAVVAEARAAIQVVNNIASALNSAASWISGTIDDIVSAFEPLNNLIDAIQNVLAATRDGLDLWDRLGDVFKNIADNFNAIDWSLSRPEPFTPASTKETNKVATAITNILLPNSVASASNNVFLTDSAGVTDEARESMEALVMGSQAYLVGLSLFNIEGVDLENSINVDTVTQVITKYMDCILNYEIYLGEDAYGNVIRHKVKSPPLEMIAVVYALSNEYWAYLERVRLIKIRAESKRFTTFHKPVTIITAVRKLYQGKYDVNDIEEEQRYINRLLAANVVEREIGVYNKITSPWQIVGEIYY